MDTCTQTMASFKNSNVMILKYNNYWPNNNAKQVPLKHKDNDIYWITGSWLGSGKLKYVAGLTCLYLTLPLTWDSGVTKQH